MVSMDWPTHQASMCKVCQTSFERSAHRTRLIRASTSHSNTSGSSRRWLVPKVPVNQQDLKQLHTKRRTNSFMQMLRSSLTRTTRISLSRAWCMRSKVYRVASKSTWNKQMRLARIDSALAVKNEVVVSSLIQGPAHDRLRSQQKHSFQK